MRVLIVEDFQPLRESMAQGLGEAGYAVDSAGDGVDALVRGRTGEYDVIILDLMLPRMDGLTVLQTLRREKCTSCVLILTAKDGVDDRVRGLDLGADDYLVKPFAFAELLSRVRAMIRRRYNAGGSIVRVGDLEIDSARRSVRRGEAVIDLSRREYALLEYLMMNAGRVVSRMDIWQHVYDANATAESNVVDVYIGLLRKKVEVEGKPRLIHTRRGQGYMLAEVE